jgi:hypothetical protein
MIEIVLLRLIPHPVSQSVTSCREKFHLFIRQGDRDRDRRLPIAPHRPYSGLDDCFAATRSDTQGFQLTMRIRARP